MSREGIDYSKWNNVNDDDDDDESDADNGATLSAAPRRSWTLEQRLPTAASFAAGVSTYKAQADELFAQAEASKDPYDYRVALNEGYLVLLGKASSVLRHANDANDSDVAAIVRCEVACRLNAACCHLRLEDWESAIEECTWV